MNFCAAVQGKCKGEAEEGTVASHTEGAKALHVDKLES